MRTKTFFLFSLHSTTSWFPFLCNNKPPTNTNSFRKRKNDGYTKGLKSSSQEIVFTCLYVYFIPSIFPNFHSHSRAKPDVMLMLIKLTVRGEGSFYALK